LEIRWNKKYTRLYIIQLKS